MGQGGQETHINAIFLSELQHSGSCRCLRLLMTRRTYVFVIPWEDAKRNLALLPQITLPEPMKALVLIEPQQASDKEKLFSVPF